MARRSGGRRAGGGRKAGGRQASRHGAGNRARAARMNGGGRMGAGLSHHAQSRARAASRLHQPRGFHNRNRAGMSVLHRHRERHRHMVNRRRYGRGNATIGTRYSSIHNRYAGHHSRLFNNHRRIGFGRRHGFNSLGHNRFGLFNRRTRRKGRYANKKSYKSVSFKSPISIPSTDQFTVIFPYNDTHGGYDYQNYQATSTG